MMDKSERAEKKEARRMVNRRKYAIETAKDVCNADAGFTPEQIIELGKLLDQFIAENQKPPNILDIPYRGNKPRPGMFPPHNRDRYKTEVIHVPPISTGTTSSIPPPTNQYPAR